MRIRRNASRETLRRSSLDTDRNSAAYTFRRSRTITGSVNSGVRAAGEDNAQLRSPRLQHHDLKKHRRKLLVYLVATLMISGVLWYLLKNYTAGIDHIRVLNSPAAEQSDLGPYRQAAVQYMKEYPFERFRFLLNTQRLVGFIAERQPEVLSASIEESDKLFDGELVLRVRQPVAVWAIQDKQYYVDSDGAAFLHSVLPPPTLGVVDKSGNELAGGTVASGRMLRFIGRVVTLVNASGIGDVTSVEIPSSSTRQVDIKIASKPYVIRTHLDRDPAGQAMDVINAVRYFSNKNIKPSYVDVRVAGKAFYQ